MQDIWNRIEQWLMHNAPNIYTDLNPGATDESIRITERTLQVSFPEDVRRSFQIHNGQRGRAPLRCGWTLLSLADILEEWHSWKACDEAGEWDGWACRTSDPIQHVFWHRDWIPLLSTKHGAFDAIDLAPLSTGIVGQIIRFVHDDDERIRLALSYRRWLEAFARDLEQDRYVVTNGGLCLKESETGE